MANKKHKLIRIFLVILGIVNLLLFVYVTLAPATLMKAIIAVEGEFILQFLIVDAFIIPIVVMISFGIFSKYYRTNLILLIVGVIFIFLIIYVLGLQSNWPSLNEVTPP